MLKPPFSVIEKREHQEYVDYIERSTLTKQTEADTSLIVKDSDEFYGKLNVYGGQRQEKRKGYNKFNIDTAANGKYINVGNGALGNSETSDTSDYIQVVVNKSYTLSYEYDTLIAEGKRGYCFFDENKQYISGSEYTSSNKNTTFTATADGYIRFAYDKNCTNIMFREGTEEKPFEPYGVMPSLSYPSKIECVGGGKAELELGTIASATGTNNASNQRVRTKDYIRVISNTECTIDADNVDEVVVFQYDENKNKILATSWLELPYTFTLNENTRYIRYAFRYADSRVLTVDEVKDKSKYLSNIEINVSNKNVLDIPKNTHDELYGITVNTDKDGILTLNGTATANMYLKLYNDNKVLTGSTVWNKKRIAKGKWVFSSRMISGEINAEANTSAYVRSKAAGDGAIDYAQLYRVLNAKEKQKQFILEEDAELVVYMWIGKDVIFNNVKLQFQLEPDELSEYISHCGETHIMPIQEKMLDGDTFEKIDGVWYEVHNKKEKIFNGNESITLQSINANGIANFFFGIALEGIDSKLFNTTECSHFTNSMDLIATVTEPNMLTQESGGLYFRVPSTLASTVAEFKEYLKNNNIQVVYPLAEPELILCTDEQSAILDKIDTYRDGTIITTDNDLCKISLRYKKDTDKEIKNLEQAIVALGGVI